MDRPTSEKREKVELFSSANSINFIKGFLSGFVFANFSKSLVIGFIIGSAAGVYLEQQSPHSFLDVGQYLKDLRRRITKKD